MAPTYEILQGEGLGLVVDPKKAGIIVYAPKPDLDPASPNFLDEIYHHRCFSHIPYKALGVVKVDNLTVCRGNPDFRPDFQDGNPSIKPFSGTGQVKLEIRTDGIFEGYAQLVKDKKLGLD